MWNTLIGQFLAGGARGITMCDTSVRKSAVHGCCTRQSPHSLTLPLCSAHHQFLVLWRGTALVLGVICSYSPFWCACVTQLVGLELVKTDLGQVDSKACKNNLRNSGLG